MKLKHQKALVALAVGCGTAAFSALNLTFAAAPQHGGHSGRSSGSGKTNTGNTGSGGQCTPGNKPTGAPTTPTATATPTTVPTATPTPTIGYNGTTTSSGTTGTTSGGTTSAAGSGYVALLEGALGRTLTDAEKTAIAAAAQTRDTAVKGALADFKTQVASLFGLAESDLDTAAKSCGKNGSNNLTTVLETALGRTLTATEKSELAALVAARDAALKAATDAYRTTVATTLGLSVAELDAKFRAYHPTGSGKGGGQRRH